MGCRKRQIDIPGVVGLRVRSITLLSLERTQSQASAKRVTKAHARLAPAGEQLPMTALIHAGEASTFRSLLRHSLPCLSDASLVWTRRYYLSPLVREVVSRSIGSWVRVRGPVVHADVVALNVGQTTSPSLVFRATQLGSYRNAELFVYARC